MAGPTTEGLKVSARPQSDEMGTVRTGVGARGGPRNDGQRWSRTRKARWRVDPTRRRPRDLAGSETVIKSRLRGIGGSGFLWRATVLFKPQKGAYGPVAAIIAE